MEYKFWRDAPTSFECNVTIEGASTLNSKARLILAFSNRSLLFESDLIGGRVSIQIPKLYEIEDERGTATLEIIAENTYFEAFSFEFELNNKRTVSIDDISIERTEQMSVIIEDVVVENEEADIPEMFKESASPKNRKYAEKAIKQINQLDKSETTDIKRILKDFEPNEQLRSWADTVFEDADNLEAKYTMYVVSQGTFDKKEAN